MSGWIKKRFSVNRGKNTAGEKEPSEKRRSFFGGSSKAKASTSNPSLENRESSIRDVALAGKTEAVDATESAEKAGDEVAGKAPALEVREPEAEKASTSAADTFKSAVAEPETVSAEKVEKHAVDAAETKVEDKTEARAEEKAGEKAGEKAADKPDSHGVSPVSTPFEDASEERSRTLELPKALEDAARRSSSLARDSRFKEEM